MRVVMSMFVLMPLLAGICLRENFFQPNCVILVSSLFVSWFAVMVNRDGCVPQ